MQPKIGRKNILNICAAWVSERDWRPPCNFVHLGRSFKATCHGGDFVIIGNLIDIDWLGAQMKRRYELKMQTLGPEPERQEEIRISNRIIRWSAEGIGYEPDQRHAEIIVKELD